MFKINKQGDEFTLLCLTDPQLNNGNFGEKSKYTVLEYTVRALCDRVKPDLCNSGRPFPRKSLPRI